MVEERWVDIRRISEMKEEKQREREEEGIKKERKK